MWSVPRSCFGCVRGKGLSEDLYVLQHAAQTSAGLQDSTLDLSNLQACDSACNNAILDFFVGNLPLGFATSAALLRWGLGQSRLCFQFFDSVCWFRQTRGTQQGGSHSPTLVVYMVSGRFEGLAAEWNRGCELPVFRAGLCLLWVLP